MLSNLDVVSYSWGVDVLGHRSNACTAFQQVIRSSNRCMHHDLYDGETGTRKDDMRTYHLSWVYLRDDGLHSTPIIQAFQVDEQQSAC